MRAETISVKGFERVVRLQGGKTGASVIACIHDTTLGPAVGCLSLRASQSIRAALKEACALARSMTWKAAAAQLSVGGGHIAVVSEKELRDRDSLLELTSHLLELFGGSLYAAEGPGTEHEDLVSLREKTPWVLTPQNGGGKLKADTAGFIAEGVFEAVCSAVKWVFGSESLENLTFAIQGLGKTGQRLVELFHKSGAKIIACDINAKKTLFVKERFPVEIVEAEEIYEKQVEVFVPCAVPHVLNSETIPKLRCRIIAGAANEQLEKREYAEVLREREILYIPDFVANAGGLIALASLLEGGGFDEELIHKRIKAIRERVTMLLGRAKNEGKSPYEAAREYARRWIGSVKQALSRLNG